MTRAPDSTAFGYNYEHFGLEHRVMDQLGGVRVGEAAPDFTATRLDGTQVKWFAWAAEYPQTTIHQR